MDYGVWDWHRGMGVGMAMGFFVWILKVEILGFTEVMLIRVLGNIGFGRVCCDSFIHHPARNADQPIISRYAISIIKPTPFNATMLHIVPSRVYICLALPLLENSTNMYN